MTQEPPVATVACPVDRSRDLLAMRMCTPMLEAKIIILEATTSAGLDVVAMFALIESCGNNSIGINPSKRFDLQAATTRSAGGT